MVSGGQSHGQMDISLLISEFHTTQQHVDLVPAPSVNWDHLHCVWMTGASVKLRAGFVVYSGPWHSLHTTCIFTMRQLGNDRSEPQSAVCSISYVMKGEYTRRCEGHMWAVVDPQPTERDWHKQTEETELCQNSKTNTDPPALSVSSSRGSCPCVC